MDYYGQMCLDLSEHSLFESAAKSLSSGVESHPNQLIYVKGTIQ